MKRLCFALCMIMIAAVAYSAPGDKRPAVTSSAIGLGTSSSPTLASVTATTSVTAPAYNSTAADGYHYIRPYNSVAFAGTPLAGMFVTTPTGPQWYTGSAWEAIGSGGASAIADLTDWPSGLTATELGYLDGATSNIQAQINAISVGSPVTTAPTYSDQTCTAGQYAFDASYAYFCRTANTWDRIALGGWSNPTPDTTPDAFVFTDETGIALSTSKTSNAITVAGINAAAAISVTGDTGFGYSKNSAACTATSGTVVAGDTVAACVTSSGSNSTATTATVTIGGVSDTYSVTTAAATPPTFSALSIDAAGTGLTATLSASTTVGSGGSGGLVLTCATAGTVTATYGSGSPGTSYAYTISPTVYSGDTCTAAYTQPGNGLEGTTGGADVASASGMSVTNGSEATQGASACTGADVFCSTWETGSDALNTGAVSPEGVFNSSTGTMSLVTPSSTFDGSSAAKYTGAGTVTTTPGSTITDGYYRIAFYVNSESVGTSSYSSLFRLYNAGEMASASITDDSTNYDNIVLFKVASRVSSATVETVGTPYAISTGTWYQAIVYYRSGSSGAISWWLYDKSGALLTSSTGTKITTSSALGIPTVVLGNNSTSSTVTLDAFAWGTSSLSALSR